MKKIEQAKVAGRTKRTFYKITVKVGRTLQPSPHSQSRPPPLPFPLPLPFHQEMEISCFHLPALPHSSPSSSFLFPSHFIFQLSSSFLVLLPPPSSSSSVCLPHLPAAGLSTCQGAEPFPHRPSSCCGRSPALGGRFNPPPLPSAPPQDNGTGMPHDRIPDMLGRVLSGESSP